MWLYAQRETAKYIAPVFEFSNLSLGSGRLYERLKEKVAALLKKTNEIYHI